MMDVLKTWHERLGGLDAQVVHIAGSKGKGTTAWLIAEGLCAHGKKVGLFTSPYILDPQEMMLVNGRPIAPERLEALLAPLRGEVSEFEAWTLAALQFFQEEACDFVILECGWGGARDATNLVDRKVLTILTHVELEHAEVLGPDLATIAREKLGICRPGVPLLTPVDQSPEVMEAAEPFAPHVVAEREFEYFHPACVGLAVAALDRLGFAFDPRVREAWSQLVIPGRFEVVERGPHTLILDGAHTRDSIASLQRRVVRFMEERGFGIPFWGVHILKDKPGDLWTLFPPQRTVWIELEHERAGQAPPGVPTAQLEEFLSGLNSEVGPQLVVLTGSFRVVEAFKRL